MLDSMSLLIFSEDPKSLADFYTKVLDRDPDWDDGDWYGFQLEGSSLGIGPHSEVKGKNPNPQRIMFNLRTEDVARDFERIKALGAKVIAEPYQPGGNMWIATFADPDGNYFQLESPWNIEDVVEEVVEDVKPKRTVH